ncbi:MAG: hypothetical protein IPJ34_02130 [Myxococcales bacterium]|nr:hypothetical protein [Myxococcales bacterium]
MASLFHEVTFTVCVDTVAAPRSHVITRRAEQLERLSVVTLPASSWTSGMIAQPGTSSVSFSPTRMNSSLVPPLTTNCFNGVPEGPYEG